MPGLLGKKFPAPVAAPMAPFYIAGAVIMYGLNSIANTMMDSPEYRNDPRNPRTRHFKPTEKQVGGS